MRKGNSPPELVEQLVLLKAGLEAENDVAIVFGAEVSGAGDLVLAAFGSKLPGKTRYMVLVITRIRAARRTWASFRIACRDMLCRAIRMRTNPLKGCGPAADSDKARANSAAMSKQRKPES